MPSMAFATGMQARLPLGPLTRGFLTTPQASLDAADWPVAPRPASTPGSRPTPGAALPGTLASPQAGHPPASCRELALGYTINLPSISAPELLDAHSGGTTLEWVLAAGRPGPGRPGGRRGRRPAPPGPGSRAAAGGPAGTRSALMGAHSGRLWGRLGVCWSPVGEHSSALDAGRVLRQDRALAGGWGRLTADGVACPSVGT